MFDIGFFELLLIAVVGLLVIGPERLPETLRTVALWWGRLKRGIQNTRAEFEQQIGADDIRRQLHNEEIMKQLHAAKEDIERTVREDASEIQHNLNTTMDEEPSADREPSASDDKPSSAEKEDSATHSAHK